MSKRPIVLKPNEVTVTELITTGPASRILGVSAETLRKFRDTGTLPHIPISGVSHYRRKDVEALAEDRQEKRRGPQGKVTPPQHRKAG